MKKLNFLLSTLLMVSVLMFLGCASSPELSEDFIVTGNEPPPEDCEIGHRTQTPGGWGAPAAGNNPGTIRDTYFEGAFPNGLKVGCGGDKHFSIRLMSAAAVENFLPSGGKPAVLDEDYVDPDSKDVKNSLASHVVALTLSNHFDHFIEDFGEAGFLLCDLVACSGDLEGKSVQEVLEIANLVLGGCTTSYTVDQAHEAVSSINENFVDGDQDNGFLCCADLETI